MPGVNWFDDACKAAHKADLLVILTENEFRALDLKRLACKMTVRSMANLRSIYFAADAKLVGFEAYEGVGR